jgi:hypothetical protein
MVCYCVACRKRISFSTNLEYGGEATIYYLDLETYETNYRSNFLLILDSEMGKV